MDKIMDCMIDNIKSWSVQRYSRTETIWNYHSVLKMNYISLAPGCTMWKSWEVFLTVVAYMDLKWNQQAELIISNIQPESLWITGL